MEASSLPTWRTTRSRGMTVRPERLVFRKLKISSRKMSQAGSTQGISEAFGMEPPRTPIAALAQTALGPRNSLGAQTTVLPTVLAQKLRLHFAFSPLKKLRPQGKAYYFFGFEGSLMAHGTQHTHYITRASWSRFFWEFWFLLYLFVLNFHCSSRDLGYALR